MKKIFLTNKLLFFFLFIYFSIVGYKLFLNPLPFYDWDEAIYMEVGREMIEKNSLIPLWQGKYWLDKPPLVMIIYGLIPKIFFFLQPEISARLFNLFLNFLFYVLTYFFILKISQSKLTSFLTVFLTSLTPLFIQRAHIVNMDVFLGIGWLGYFLFYPNVFLSTIFLSLAVLSKSLLGFYPIFLNLSYYIILFLIKKIKMSEFKKNIKYLTIQCLIFFFWYLVMFLKFGNSFIYQHVFESHFKRVTASIEFHFGERIFYFTEMIKQLNYFSVFAFLGLLLIIFMFVKKKITFEKFYYFNLFLPWFLFLNLTKTKIFWYLYPALPQFAFYASYLFFYFLNKTKIKKLLIAILIISISLWGIIKKNFLESQFSSYDKFYQFAITAKNNCQKIYFLPENSHRKAIDELEKMNLTITTTKWWGGHPALVYYTDNKIEFIYNEIDLIKKAVKKNKNKCFAYFNNEDIKFNQNQVKLIKQFDDILLFQ